MKILVLFLALAVSAFASNNPIQMPSEVTLTTGRVLRNVNVVRWDADRVVIKHAGGTEPIPYQFFKTPSPAEIAAIRPGTTKPSSEKSIKADETNRYHGTMFIVTKDGPQVLDGATIHVLPEEAWLKVQSRLQPIRLPPPLMTVTSGREGKFEFSVPAGTRFMLLAQASLKVDLANTEQYEWRIRSSGLDPDNAIELTGDNDYGSVQRYELP